MKNCAKHRELTVLTNGGTLLFDQKGRFIFLPFSVHVKNIFLVTILSLKYTNKTLGVCVTMDTSIEKAMSMIMKDGTVFKFK